MKKKTKMFNLKVGVSFENVKYKCVCSVLALNPLMRIHNVNRHENKRKSIKWEGVSKLLTGSEHHRIGNLLIWLENYFST